MYLFLKEASWMRVQLAKQMIVNPNPDINGASARAGASNVEAVGSLHGLNATKRATLELAQGRASDLGHE
jgi:hypothetical protein